MEEENKYTHPHFLALVTIILLLVLTTLITQGCATTAQLYVDPRYKIQPTQNKSYPEINVGVKINVGPKITFKKKGGINPPN